jgi:hypothetical protein
MYAGIPPIVTLTPSTFVGRLFPAKSEKAQLRVVVDKFAPVMETQAPGAIPGRKLAPLTTPTDEIVGPETWENAQVAPDSWP